jgi:hypothetical protein
LTKEAFESVGSKVYAAWTHGSITALSDGKTITTSHQP